MRIGVFSNNIKDKDHLGAMRIADIVKSKSLFCSVYCSEDEIKLITLLNEDAIDMLMVLGGDGTMLSIVEACASNSVPILGLNFGNIGFLSELEKKDDIGCFIDKYIEGKYYIEERDMLEATLYGEKFYALNEVLVCRAEDFGATTIDVHIDNEYIDRYNGDGVLLATPTGSTAYSMSAGGPILAPNMKAIIINPVCPHSLHNRPIVVSNNSNIKLTLKNDRISAKLILDGRQKATLDNEGIVSVKKADITARFIRFKKDNFYQRLLIKLNYWSNTGADR